MVQDEPHQARVRAYLSATHIFPIAWPWLLSLSVNTRSIQEIEFGPRHARRLLADLEWVIWLRVYDDLLRRCAAKKPVLWQCINGVIVGKCTPTPLKHCRVGAISRVWHHLRNSAQPAEWCPSMFGHLKQLLLMFCLGKTKALSHFLYHTHPVISLY